MSRLIRKLIKDVNQTIIFNGNSAIVDETVTIDGHRINPNDPGSVNNYGTGLNYGDIGSYTGNDVSYGYDTGTSYGVPGVSIPSYDHVITPSIPTPELVTIARPYRRAITDYSAASLAELESAGGVPYALFDDGTRRRVEWSEVFNPRKPAYTASLNVSAIAEAKNQHFWLNEEGAHVTADYRTSWEEEYEEPNHGTLAAPTVQNPWNNILINSLGVLIRKGLIDLAALTDGSISFYDGRGNTANNVIATFGTLGAQIGKNGENHLVLSNDGLSAYDSNGDLIPVYASNIAADHAIIEDLDANYAHITNGAIDNADINYANIIDLAAHYARIDLANVNTEWLDRGIIKDAAISDAMIASISANKLTAGEIDASRIIVTNLLANNIKVNTINGHAVENVTVADALTTHDDDINTLYNMFDQAYEDINNRIDSQIETYTLDHVPTLNGEPYDSWFVYLEDSDGNYILDSDGHPVAAEDHRASHIGDVAYVINPASEHDGFTYRFAYDYTNNAYMWTLIKDNQIASILGDISDLQTFSSTTSHWIEETDEEIEEIWQQHNTLSGVVDKTIVDTRKVWFAKASTSAPSKPLAQVTINNSSTYGQWNKEIPTYNSGYPYYFSCYEYEYTDGTYGWSDVVYDSITSDLQSKVRQGIKSTTPLWFTKANTTAPSKPSAHVVVNNPETYSTWNIAVPTYNEDYPNYFYCYEWQFIDGSYGWSDVIFDSSTTENQANSRNALSQVASKVDSSTFRTFVEGPNGYNDTITNLTSVTNEYSAGKLKQPSSIKANSAIGAGRIICGTSTGYKSIGASEAFELSYPLLYASTTVSANETSTDIYMSYSNVNYSTSGTIEAGTSNKILYLKGTVISNVFTIASSNFLTTEVPTEEDNFYYIPLGLMTSYTNGAFSSDNTLYAFVGDSFQQVNPSVISSHSAINELTRTSEETTSSLRSMVNAYDGLSSDFQNLKFGGTNLVRNSNISLWKKLNGTLEDSFGENVLDDESIEIDTGESDIEYNATEHQTYTPDVYNIARFDLTENLIQGDEYTLSIWGSVPIRSDKNPGWYSIYWGGGSVKICDVYITGYPSSVTFKAPESFHNDTRNSYIYIYNSPSAGAYGTSYDASIHKIKIERGNRATDWTPSELDSTYYILSKWSEFKQTVDGFMFEVGNNYLTSDGLGGALATLGITAEEINAKVDNNGVIAAINASSDGVESDIKISADRINFEGAAIFGNYSTKENTVTDMVQLWFTKSDQVAPSKPTNAVTSTSTDGNAWRLVVPEYDSSYPYYYYCYQKVMDNDSFKWTDVVRDRAMEEAQYNSRQASDSIANYIATNNQVTSGLQSQIDAQVDIWYYSGAPTDISLPTSNWQNSTDKDKHVGDLYYDTDTYYTYKFTKTGNNYYWDQIQDEDISTAIASAQSAQTTADNKKTVFTSTPTVPYDVGDLWVTGNDIRYAMVSKTISQAYSEHDWIKTTADALLIAKLSEDLASYISSNEELLNSIKAQVDSQVDIWYYSAEPTLNNNPASEWTDYLVDSSSLNITDSSGNKIIASDKKDDHLGDLYYDTSTGYSYRFTKSGNTYSWTRIKDSDISSALSAAQDAQSTADGKRTVFTETPRPPYDIGDLWVNGSVVKYATVAKNSSQSYSSTDWSLTATDDTLAKTGIVTHTQLWYTKANSTAPDKPTSQVTSTSTSGGAWRIIIPAYSTSYPYYFYCYQLKKADGNYTWTDVVRDRGMEEAQSESREAAKTATNHLTEATNQGLKIHRSDDDSNNFIRIDSDGMKVYKNGDQVASFGDTATLGATLDYAARLTPWGLEVYKNGNQVAEIGNPIILGSISGQGTRIDTTGMQIFKGGNQVASFGNSILLGSTLSQAARIDSNGMQIFKGGYQVASFGNSVRIGKTSDTYAQIDNSGYMLRSPTGGNFDIVYSENLYDSISKEEYWCNTTSGSDAYFIVSLAYMTTMDKIREIEIIGIHDFDEYQVGSFSNAYDVADYVYNHTINDNITYSNLYISKSKVHQLHGGSITFLSLFVRIRYRIMNPNFSMPVVSIGDGIQPSGYERSSDYPPCSFILGARNKLGDAGYYSIATGVGNQINSEDSLYGRSAFNIVHGSGNRIGNYIEYSYINGSQNSMDSEGRILTNRSCYIFGSRNDMRKSNYSMIFGAHNTVKSDSHYSAAFGYYNDLYGEYNYLFGMYLQGSSGLFACGKFNKVVSDAIFCVGNGGNRTTSARNAFLVLEDGSVYVNGTNSSNGSSVTSDARIKELISDITPEESSEFISKLIPKKYYKRNGDRKEKQIGFYAQDIEDDEDFGEYLVTIDNSGNYDIPDFRLLNYQGLIAPLVGAVQDLQDKVDTLTKQNQDLEARLAKLESLLFKEGDI